MNKKNTSLVGYISLAIVLVIVGVVYWHHRSDDVGMAMTPEATYGAPCFGRTSQSHCRDLFVAWTQQEGPSRLAGESADDLLVEGQLTCTQIKSLGIFSWMLGVSMGPEKNREASFGAGSMAMICPKLLPPALAKKFNGVDWNVGIGGLSS